MLSFADDSIILAESAEDLQKGLHAVNIYGNNIIWNLTINTAKTKFAIFSTRQDS